MAPASTIEMPQSVTLSTDSSSSSQTSSEVTTSPGNQTMLQGFEWWVPNDKQHWKRLEAIVPTLAQLGINTLWIPPACKGFGPESIGDYNFAPHTLL